MVKFLLKKGRIFNKEFIFSLLAFIKYRYEEEIIAKSARKIMVVSQVDADYLKSISNTSAKFLVVPNGAYFEHISETTKSEYFRLGILSSWGSPRAFEENNWFIQTYFKKYIKAHPNAKLILAGRGKLIEKYRGDKNIEIMGEVDTLDQFFSNIDVFLSINPKGCGILNRVLDSFAHKKIVVGIEKSFSGFTYMKSYLSFNDYKSFEKSLDFVKNNPSKVKEIEELAFLDMKKYNDWDSNYKSFINALLG